MATPRRNAGLAVYTHGGPTRQPGLPFLLQTDSRRHLCSGCFRCCGNPRRGRPLGVQQMVIPRPPRAPEGEFSTSDNQASPGGARRHLRRRLRQDPQPSHLQGPRAGGQDLVARTCSFARRITGPSFGSAEGVVELRPSRSLVQGEVQFSTGSSPPTTRAEPIRGKPTLAWSPGEISTNRAGESSTAATREDIKRLSAPAFSASQCDSAGRFLPSQRGGIVAGDCRAGPLALLSEGLGYSQSHGVFRPNYQLQDHQNLIGPPGMSVQLHLRAVRGLA